jgi:DNA-binding SARP family transcriptional activator
MDHDAILDSAGPAPAAWWFTHVGYLKFNQADYEAAHHYFVKSGEIIRQHGLREALREIILFRVMVEFRTAGWSVAGQTLAEVESMPPTDRPMAEALLSIYRARKQQAVGNPAKAAELAIVSQQGARRANSRFQEAVFGLFNAEILCDAGRLSEASAMLAQVKGTIEHFEVFSYQRAAPSFVEGFIALASGQRETAIVRLRESLALARTGNRKLFLRYLETAMPPMFKLALEENIEVDLVMDLIRLFRLKPSKHSPDSWPWPVRIRTFGRFEILVGGEAVQFSRKQPRKPLMLLKALISFGATDVPDQMLCDALWGDEDGDAAANALDITVVRLRKLLGGNETILRLGSRISLNPELCWIDARVFESRAHDPADRSPLNLYRGTFLPEDSGEPWSVATRERLRGKFIHALSTLGDALEQDGQWDEAMTSYVRGIDADPVVETFHQGLMRCLNIMGRRSEAISAYRRMKQTLSVVLGVPPSEASQNLYRDLLQDQIQDGTEMNAVNGQAPVASVTALPIRKVANSRQAKR